MEALPGIPFMTPFILEMSKSKSKCWDLWKSKSLLNKGEFAIILVHMFFSLILCIRRIGIEMNDKTKRRNFF